MLLFLLTFGVSALSTLLIVRSSHSHARFSADHDFGGPQKFHFRPCRASAASASRSDWWPGSWPSAAVRNEAEQRFAALLLLCGMPAFGSGLFEDISKRVEPRYRLVATALSALLAVFAVDAIARPHRPLGLRLDRFVHRRRGLPGDLRRRGHRQRRQHHRRLQRPGVDVRGDDPDGDRLRRATRWATTPWRRWRSWAPAPFSASSSGTFPAGLIFLGDGGAYFLGFYAAELGILLLPATLRSRRSSRC